ncbi:MAG TPA: methyltransferase domain-containing protein [Mucilaginibacter sp.]|nr:methyltransferase domain-containing protein [Mucilaginibacter sp.]
MGIKQKIYQAFPIIPKTNLAIGQRLHEKRLKRNAGNIEALLADKTNIYTNVGCGDAGMSEGWINLDNSLYKNVSYAYDCRKKLPFADNSVKGIFCEHFFEHIDYNTEVPHFLASCYRCLQKGGVLRIIVPDAEKYLRGYCQDGWDELKKTRPLNDDLTDGLMGGQYRTKMQLINEVFRQSGEHKYAWDFETMKLVMNEAGFTNVYKMEYGKSHDPVLQIDQLVRKPESLYVEAIK